MKERPILFSAPMVRAILEGRKSQTRRACRGQRELSNIHDFRLDQCPYGAPGDRLWVRETLQVTRHWRQVSYAADDATCYESETSPADERADQLIDRYGTFNFEESRGVPSIHMPRWASRILLEVTDVRVERLQAISEADAIAEGVDGPMCAAISTSSPWVNVVAPCAVHTYAALWDSINGPGAWLANPWVWAITFRRLEPRA
jgi:hypothetical protein